MEYFYGFLNYLLKLFILMFGLELRYFGLFLRNSVSLGVSLGRFNFFKRNFPFMTLWFAQAPSSRQKYSFWKELMNKSDLVNTILWGIGRERNTFIVWKEVSSLSIIFLLFLSVRLKFHLIRKDINFRFFNFGMIERNCKTSKGWSYMVKEFSAFLMLAGSCCNEIFFRIKLWGVKIILFLRSVLKCDYWSDKFF